MVSRVIVFLEGMDSVGKSTQAQLLWKYLVSLDDFLPVMSLHFSSLPTKEKSEKNYKSMFDIMSENKDINFICDRSHLGEMVYAHKYRGYDGSYVYELEPDWLSAENCFLFILEDNIHNLMIREDGNSLAKETKDLLEDQLRFRDSIHSTKIHHTHVIKITNKSIEEVSQEIIKLINHETST
jgi:thymidylate kinase